MENMSLIPLVENAPRWKINLQDFSVIFQKQKGLLPARTQDHHIKLKKGSQPVNRYPYVQNVEREKIVKEML